MKTKIFYFTGTGNSLLVAKDIANELGDVELISIPAVISGNINTDSPIIGIIFPVYIWGMPKMVVDFVNPKKVMFPDPVISIFITIPCSCISFCKVTLCPL